MNAFKLKQKLKLYFCRINYVNYCFSYINFNFKFKSKKMAKVTEQDVITFLRDKISTLTAELKKTQAALDAFSGKATPVTANKPAVVESPEPVKSRRGRKPAPRKEVLKPLDVPEEFDSNGKLDSKIAFILSKNGALFNTEIIERLKELEPEKDADKLSKAVMVKLSALHKANRIRGEKEGRKFKYQL